MIRENNPSPDPSAASDATVAAIEPIVMQLRQAFQQASQTPIEQLVSEAPEELRPELVKALVAEDFLLRQRAGQQPELQEYLERLANYRDVIEQAWPSIQQRMLLPTADLAGSPAGPPTAIDDPDAPTCFGSYQVLKQLGSGAFGSVYQARHQETGAIVAIKMLKAKWAGDPECGQAMREQFAAEAQTMLKFDHPNIVRVISLDDQADPPYFVQEFIDGQTLRARLRQGRPQLTEALRYAIQIADALAHMHSREKWHRDLKPENILLDRDDNVRVADFGLVLDNAQRWNLKGQTAGTRAYMAPEQVRGRTHLLNARCDLWAFGVVLYELLVGRRPFNGEGEQLVTEILERTPPAPRELNRSLPRRVNRLCMQCLAKRDADRPDAAADIADDLREELEKLTSESAKSGNASGPDSSVPQPAGSSTTVPVSGDVPSDTDPGSVDSAKSDAPPVEYPVPTLRKFTADQAALYLRLMPRSYSNPGELPELIAYWKQRIEERDPLRTFRVGILVGVSGCGKSSLLEAGLVPQLADHVIPILLEASDKDTEQRILVRLRRAFPEADPQGQWSLSDWLFRLRSSDLLSEGRKVVIILDQFEQWLNAHGGEPTNELLEALEQCDGQRLQTIVCVREGFHASLMRFVQKLGILLDEHDNYATAHRFTPDHARFVMEQFGRGLKRLDDPLTDQQTAFLTATVEGLAESDRGVVCVRLVVLASVMQDRPWTIDELEKLGGLDGIGAQFLVDCFEGRTASEQYRRYLPAAMRVLADLLPAEGLEIKDVRSYDQLLAASELDKLQFDDLLNILSRKLFLLTLVEADAGTAEPDSRTSPLATRHYQLTHDFLVPSIREWLARKLRETKEGRALLRLQERTSAWTSKPENRNLPSLWEWITIRRLTDRQKWKPNEKTVMRRAGRVHAIRSGLMASAITILAMLGIVVRGQVVAQQELARVEGLVAQLVTAEPAQLPDIVSQLQRVPELAEPLVLPLLKLDLATTDERRSKLHAQLSSVGRDNALIDPLVEELLSNKVAYIGPIVTLLQPHSAEVKDKLSSLLKDPTVDVNRRFRAGVALAGFVEPANAWDPDDLKLIADQLVSAIAEYQPVLRENLRPIAEQLLGPIEVVFKDLAASDAMRLGAANAVADFAANNGGLLTRLLADATPEQYQVLYPLVETARPAEGITELARIAAMLPPDELGSVPRIAFGQRRANAAVSLLRLDEREKVLPVFDYTDDPEALTQFIFRCRPRGIGPEPLLEVLDILTRRVSEGPSNAITNAVFQQNARARYAVLLALGEFTLDELPVGRRESLIAQLSDWYANDPSSGVHGASGWLLRQWGQNEIVTQVDQTPVPYSPDREWFTLAINVQPTSPPAPEAEGETNAQEEESETAAEGDSEDTGSGDTEEPLSTEPATPEALPTKTFYYTFIVFPAGEFEVGSLDDEPDRSRDRAREMRHPVKQTRPFALLDREITWEELIAFNPIYARFMQQSASSPNAAGAGAHWYDSVMFCRWLGVQMGLSESDQCYPDPEMLDSEQYARDPQVTWAPRAWPLDLDNRGFRLPTESEWEVVARSGTQTAYGFGSEVALLNRFGWFVENSDKQTNAPKELRPSIRGLFDLHGNLFEWTHDWYEDYSADLVTDPMVSAGGSVRVLRGGSWNRSAAYCRSANRIGSTPTARSNFSGVRLALSPSGVSRVAEPETVGEAEPFGVGTEGAEKEEE